MTRLTRATRWIITYLTALFVIAVAGAFIIIRTAPEPELPIMPVSKPPVFEYDRPDRWELYTHDYAVVYEYTYGGVHLLYTDFNGIRDRFEFADRESAIEYGTDKFNFFRGTE